SAAAVGAGGTGHLPGGARDVAGAWRQAAGGPLDLLRLRPWSVTGPDQVGARDDPNELPPLDDGDASDVVLEHQLFELLDGGLGRGRHHRAAPDAAGAAAAEAVAQR